MGRILSCAVVLATAGWAAAGPVYRIDVLDDRAEPGLAASRLTHVNDAGVAAGSVRFAGAGQPTLPATYTAGGPAAVVPGAALIVNSVNGINAAGAVVGYGVSTGGPGGGVFVAANGGVRFFVPAGSLDVVFPGGIGNSGTVYGDVFVDVGGVTTVRTFVAHPDGTSAVLPAPAGYGGFVTSSFVTPALSDAGLLAAIAVSDDFTALLGILYDLPTGAIVPLAVPAGYAEGYAYQVTPGGVVFGELFGGADSRYGFWNPDGSFRGFLDAPIPTGGLVLVNDAGQAVGLLDGVPYLSAGGAWSPVPVGLPAGYAFESITGFNARGDFVGSVRGPDGRSWGYLASAPAVPEPATLGLFAVGGLLFTRRLGRRADAGGPA